MQENTRSQKPKLALGLKKNVTKHKLSNIEEVVEGVDVSIEGSLNIESLISQLVEVLPIPTQFEEENLSSELNKEIINEFYRIRQEDFVSTSASSEGGSPSTIDSLGGGGIPPPIPSLPPFPPIDPLVRRRGLPIIVPQGLVSVDIPSNLSKFYGTKNEDLSRHMKKFIERVIILLITNHGYWLVWFPITLERERLMSGIGTTMRAISKLGINYKENF